VAALNQLGEFGFEGSARRALAAEFAHQLLQRCAAVGQFADVVEEGRSYDPLYWGGWN
jgi:hypothetical protein